MALSGTIKNPLKMPSRSKRNIVPGNCGPDQREDSVVIVSPSAPKGSNPYSTLAPEILPASRQPMPTPMPIAASGSPTCQCSSFSWAAS